MAPAKRARPSFSPPRPGKSKSKTKSVNKDAVPKRRGRTSDASTRKSKSNTRPRKRQQTPSAHNSDSLPSSPETADSRSAPRSLSPTASSRATSESDARHHNHRHQAEDEADMMLVEVSTTDQSEKPSIPLALIHRIAAESWQDATTTKMSTDARRVLGRYVDTFVREAVARCAFGVAERDGRGDDEEIGRKGWVDVDDLERVGGVLCLDF